MKRLVAAAVLALAFVACGGETGDVSTTTSTELLEPRPTTTDDPSVRQGVTAGAFCSPEGARGRTSTGIPMECVKAASDDRARWRQAAAG